MSAAEILPIVWFVGIAILWTGFFILEGFDFGVGMLLPFLGKKDQDRRVMINTIGPLWDGNEVWLITAAGAMFAAFPEWYATIFSALYLPLFLVLAALIVRGVSFEYRHQRNTDAWRTGFDRCIIFASFTVPLVLGIAFANFVRGLPITRVAAGGDNPSAVGGWIMEASVANIFSLLLPFGLLGGLTFIALFMFHGALFIAVKTSGDIRERSRDLAAKLGIGAVVLLGVLSIWGAAAYGKGLISWILAALSIGGVLLALAMNARGREGWAFTGTAVSIATLLIGIFVSMFPYVVKALDPVHHLSIAEAAATERTLTIMTWAAAIFLPVVIAYQAWTIWVFRKRISTHHMPTHVH
jgi:cytochrome d ubiquinol oxidase subunit II